jgi:hypothetical protein
LQLRGVQPAVHAGRPPAGCLAACMPCGPQVVPKGNGKVPLLGVAADVGAAPGDSEHQALIAEDFDGTENGVAAYIMLLL